MRGFDPRVHRFESCPRNSEFSREHNNPGLDSETDLISRFERDVSGSNPDRAIFNSGGRLFGKQGAALPLLSDAAQGYSSDKRCTNDDVVRITLHSRTVGVLCLRKS